MFYNTCDLYVQMSLSINIGKMSRRVQVSINQLLGDVMSVHRSQDIFMIVNMIYYCIGMEKVANPRRDGNVGENHYSRRPIECIG